MGKTVELRGVRKNGDEFPLELSLNAVELAGELQFIGSIRDQTERQRMRAMLAQSEKLASIGLLSAGVAHEINNPLAYVANNLAVLERDMKGVLEIMALYEAAHEPLRAAAPGMLREVEEKIEDLDWDYVRDNLQRMLCADPRGGAAGRQHRPEPARAGADLAAEDGVGVGPRPARGGAGDDPRPAPAARHRGRRPARRRCPASSASRRRSAR